MADATPDPSRDGFRLTLTGAGGRIVLARAVPAGLQAGGTGWVVRRPAGAWVYKDPAGTAAGGITRLAAWVTGPAPGVLRFSLRGTSAGFRVTEDQAPVQVVVDVGRPPSGDPTPCGARAFAAPGHPHPACTFRAGGDVLICR